MKALASAVGLLVSTASVAQSPGDAPLGARRASAEVWLYTEPMSAALQPLAPLAGKVVREGLCPALPVGPDGVLYVYQTEAQFSVKRVRDRSWKVDDVRFTNPSGCEMLDAEAKRLLAEALPLFVEPRIDADENGWLRVPKIQLKVDD